MNDEHQPIVVPLLKESYLAMIRNAAKGENHLFRNFFITMDGKQMDALANGALGCGVLVSSVLYLQNSVLDALKQPHWISFVHASVASTEHDMTRNGWYPIDDLRDGAVITWEARQGQYVPVIGDMHLHMGFSIGNERAVSNGSNSTLMPEEHHITYDGTRRIIRRWWHPVLD
jgi:hypothetical protein